MSTLLLSVCDEHVVIVFCSGRAVTTAAIDGWSRCSLVGVVSMHLLPLVEALSG